MTTQARRAGGDVTATPVPFSYAQAAKGLSSSGPSAPGSVKQTSGRTTPSTDAVTSPTAAPSSALPPSVPSWADDAEAHDNREDPQTSTVPSKQVNGDHAPTKEAVESLASSETTAKDDDVASLQNASESTSNWENKSQASTSVDKTSEPGEKRPVKGKGKNAEKVPIKPLQEAPVPAVNPWMKRRDELKAKQAAQKPAPKSVTSATAGVIANGAARPSSGAVKKPNGSAATEAELKPKSGEDEKVGSVRKDVKSEVDSERAKKGGRGRPHEKDFKQPATALPLPPDRDQESWPTPENAVDEDKKKAQVKGENPDAERKESSSGRPHGRKEWVPVPHTPSVIFNTPLPNTMSSRRGGRGGGRGGAQGSGRGGSFAANSDKDATVPSTVSNGDGSKRGRPESTSGHGSTPKEEGENSAGIAVQAASNLVPTGEKTLKGTNGSENESAKAAPVTSEATASPQMQGQSNTFPRQHPQNRPAKGRRGDFVPQGEKKKDGENMSPAKDTFPSHDRLSSAVDANGHDDAERRHPQDAQNGHRQPGSNERRQFGSYSGRERGRGGGRGGRNYQNNSHQFSNGHTPLQSSSSFPMRSPTTFHPEQPHYFPPGPQGRSYRNGHRSQSVTNENMYRQAPGFSGGAQHVAPINTFVPGMYDYSMTQHPMSAVPFGPFVDPSTLSSMVLTQLEYYFSVDNLCKDMFLRKHMDSKGFVFLDLIASFARIQKLTSDLELIKWVCYHSHIIDFRIGQDGKERLRRRDGWEQWVLAMSDRDASAQNDGPDALHNPPLPHPAEVDQSSFYSAIPHVSPTGPAPHPQMNGVQPSNGADSAMGALDNMANGQATNGINGFSGSNGHLETSTKAVSGEPDSFSDAQVETLSVIVRKQELPQVPTSLPSATRTFSNGSINSKSPVVDDSLKIDGRQLVSDTTHGQGLESRPQDGPPSSLSPFAAPHLRLHWVKGQDAPVSSLPVDSSYEPYTHLHSKAIEQRLHAPHGSCPYDMDVLYQFWSHFLVRNFNLQMYQEFRQLACDDAENRGSEVGLTNLINFYGESLLSTQNPIRRSVARHYVELVNSRKKSHPSAREQLRSAYHDASLHPRSRQLLHDMLDPELETLLQ